jgi:hypothetical protein
MCWNPDISINTFLFACLALVFIYLANTYTKYKSPAFKNPLVYLVVFGVASMQLIEFFLWRNLKNKNVNRYLSIIAANIVVLQLIALILMVNSRYLKYALLLILAIAYFAVVYYSKFTGNIQFYTSVGENGHLIWEWASFKGIERVFVGIFILLYLIPAVLIGNTPLTYLIMGSLFISLFFYYKYNTWGSMWCWIANLFLLYFIADILLIQPFYEYNGLC